MLEMSQPDPELRTSAHLRACHPLTDAVRSHYCGDPHWPDETTKALVCNGSEVRLPRAHIHDTLTHSTSHSNKRPGKAVQENDMSCEYWRLRRHWAGKRIESGEESPSRKDWKAFRMTGVGEEEVSRVKVREIGRGQIPQGLVGFWMSSQGFQCYLKFWYAHVSHILYICIYYILYAHKCIFNCNFCMNHGVNVTKCRPAGNS